MIKIISYTEWASKYEDDLDAAYMGLKNPSRDFESWSRMQYQMWKQDAEDRNADD